PPGLGIRDRLADIWTRRPMIKENLKEKAQDQPTVFVIDDDEAIRQALSSLFRSIELQVEVFGSSQEFLQTKLPDAPSCLILDVRLPGLSGLGLQAELENAGIHIPIVFITGHGDIPMSVKAMKAGAIEFLTKPIRDQDLLDAVRAALDRDRHRREYEKRAHSLRSRFEALSHREQQVMTLVATGLMNKQVAAEIGISE